MSRPGSVFETFRITGSEEMEAFRKDPSQHQPAPTLPGAEILRANGSEADDEVPGGQDPRNSSGPPSLPDPAELDCDMSGWAFVGQRDALREGAWVSYTPSGTAFCVTCACLPVILPTAPLSLGAGETCRTVPRHFHTDPFHDHAVEIHFLKAHYMVFSGGVEEMLEEYGRIGMSREPGLVSLAHNL